MVYTSNAINFDEGDTIEDGRHIHPLFSFNAGTKSSNSSILPCLVRYAGRGSSPKEPNRPASLSQDFLSSRTLLLFALNPIDSEWEEDVE
ncbi:unnamed protein product [Sphenostylis stenocarpa]|uniref:Uncharacterized protein n=1 Tax=Sphenostylis stenocarpa TaxID=92480 RepID=A0AA86VHD8_9FABA|nr:unnamed protein product [Sphenostylis stenocarpa]